MSRKYVSFDIEISRTLPDGFDDWKSFRPLGISCASTWDGEGEPQIWYSRESDGSPATQMSREDLQSLVRYLQTMQTKGYTLLTWNGLGFDFDVLAEESGMFEECRSMALNHVDMMFHIFCLKGFGLALDKAAKGMSLPGKSEGMNGSLAPKYWQEGRRQEVLVYVAQDARTTLDVARAVEEHKQLRWTSQRGDLKILKLKDGWLTVSEAVKLSEPDTSRMQRPWKRSKFIAWTEKKQPDQNATQSSLF